MCQQRPHTPAQRLQIHFQAGEQEQRGNAQGGQQSDHRIMCLIPSQSMPMMPNSRQVNGQAG